jgi:hypothetical protein
MLTLDAPCPLEQHDPNQLTMGGEMNADRLTHACAKVWCALALAAAMADSASAASTTVRWSDPGLAALARELPIGGRLRIEGAVLEPGGQPEAFELERFRVFAPDARIVVHGDAGTSTLPAPAHAYFRGTVAGRAGSRVMLTALVDGGLRGLIADAGRYWLAAQGPGEAQPALQEVSDHPALAAAARPFECGTDRLPGASPEGLAGRPPAGDLPAAPERAPDPNATVRVGVETDFEYYQLFGSVSAAVAYAGDLFAYASTYYTAEVNTDFWISHVSLWTTASDPWTQTTTLCGLAEFGKYWNLNMGQVSRTIAHFLSGKAAGGGIAWVGVLCASGFTVDISSWGCSLSPTTDLYGGAYGLSADLSGSFNIANPGVVWDIYVMSHEVGHNFNSAHTHCFNPPVDQCWGSESGCYSGPPSLPCATPGAGCGTIMSYCHTISPGMGNISLTFGLNHPYGYQPWRVPVNVMRPYVASVAASNPACLLTMFADGFEGGDSSAWSSTVP